MTDFQSVEELLNSAESSGKSIAEITAQFQSADLGLSPGEITGRMLSHVKTMRDSIEKGLHSAEKSMSGLTGGDARRLLSAQKEGRLLGGLLFETILTRALAVSEVNATMGKIVSAPTAGSCGIIPSVIVSVAESKKIGEQGMAMALLTASGIGLVIANRASLSGAHGGCQAECGSAAAMAAAAAVEMVGGSPRMAANACALALKNLLGLACDPVAGLVEVPCVKRNATCAAVALAAADMALAGIESAVPPDEVIDAMESIGRMMPSCLKETSEGGLAATPAAHAVSERILKHSLSGGADS